MSDRPCWNCGGVGHGPITRDPLTNQGVAEDCAVCADIPPAPTAKETLTTLLADIESAIASGVTSTPTPAAWSATADRVRDALAAAEWVETRSWACGRCGKAPEQHAGGQVEQECIYDPVLIDLAAERALVERIRQVCHEQLRRYPSGDPALSMVPLILDALTRPDTEAQS